MVTLASVLLWIKRPDNQSPRGARVMLFWRKSQCKNAKVNKEWLLLGNKPRERAFKVDSVVQEREGRWASFSSAKAQWVCKDTQWSPSTTSINRRLTGFSNCFCLCSELLVMDGFKEMNCIKKTFLHNQESWLTEKCYFTITSTNLFQ